MPNEILQGVKGISFDFWYTIARYETEEEWRRQDEIRVREFSDILAELGFEFPVETIERILREVGAECEAERLRTEMEVPSREVVARCVKRLGIRKRLGGGISRLLRSFDEALLKVKVVAEPGAAAVLSELKRRGYPMVLLSNTSHGYIIKRIMEREGLAQYFDHLLFTDELGPRKPNPRAFEAMLERLGTEPAETAHVGDRLELDVLGARRSGVRSVLYLSNPGTCCDGYPRPDFCIHDLNELIQNKEE